MIPGPKTTLTLQAVTNTSDSQGGFTDVWSNVAMVTGGLHLATGSEALIADQQGVRITHRFFMDYPTAYTITNLKRFVMGARVFNIRFIKNPGTMNHHLEVWLEEVNLTGISEG